MTTKRKQIPKFGSGVLADSAHADASGKLSCKGLFTVFWAWAFPCTRSGKIIATIFDLPKGITSVSISLGRRGRGGKKKSINIVDVNSDEADGALTLHVNFKHRFTASGKYEFILNFRDFPGSLRIPFNMLERAWPKFTTKEKAFAEKNPEVQSAFRMNVHCASCEHAYIFEESLLLQEPKGGVMQFPESGVFVCEECGHELQLRDIQGQLRQSLKDNLAAHMRRTPDV